MYKVKAVLQLTLYSDEKIDIEFDGTNLYSDKEIPEDFEVKELALKIAPVKKIEEESI